MLGAPYDRELTEAPEMAREQAELIAADIVSQGGPVMRGELLTIDSQAVALIAYLQRIGTDIFAPDTRRKRKRIGAVAPPEATEVEAVEAEELRKRK